MRYVSKATAIDLQLSRIPEGYGHGHVCLGNRQTAVEGVCPHFDLTYVGWAENNSSDIYVTESGDPQGSPSKCKTFGAPRKAILAISQRECIDGVCETRREMRENIFLKPSSRIAGKELFRL